jgi:gliding motility-associated lipoprotein GldH
MSRWIFGCFILLLAACSEEGKIADQVREIPNSRWNYDQIPEFPFVIDKPGITYNFFLKLRIQKSYPYENLYLLTHIRTPDGKIQTKRVNFTLTDDLGRPLGKSSGNSIDYELPMFSNRKMEGAGQYAVAIEQNLRDSVVNGIESIGIKIKEGTPVF